MIHRLFGWFAARANRKEAERERLARNARRRELYARRRALRAVMLAPLPPVDDVGRCDACGHCGGMHRIDCKRLNVVGWVE